jgi:phosphoglycerate kinase
MQEEITALTKVLNDPAKPLAAIVGGSKVSTKLELLSNLVGRVDHLIIGGAMANTFLAAQGHEVGTSLFEKDMTKTAKDILKLAGEKNCNLVLPVDVVVAKNFAAHAASKVCAVDAIPKSEMILDVGPRSLRLLEDVISSSKTLVWNGPVGAFETAPFDATTVQIARLIALATREGKLHSVAGGGDTVAALAHAGLSTELSYLSTAGGAFLEWLEGKELPGIAALMKQSDASRKRA